MERQELASNANLMRMLILSAFLYASESWTLTAEIERRIQALEMICYGRRLNISYKDHVTTEEVRNRIQNAVAVHGMIYPNPGTIQESKAEVFRFSVRVSDS